MRRATGARSRGRSSMGKAIGSAASSRSTRIRRTSSIRRRSPHFPTAASLSPGPTIAVRNRRPGRWHQGPDLLRRRHCWNDYGRDADRRNGGRECGEGHGRRHRPWRRCPAGRGSDLFAARQCRRPLRDRCQHRRHHRRQRHAARLRGGSSQGIKVQGEGSGGPVLHQDLQYRRHERQRGPDKRNAHGRFGAWRFGERHGGRHRSRHRPGCRQRSHLLAGRQCRRRFRDQCQYRRHHRRRRHEARSGFGRRHGASDGSGRP